MAEIATWSAILNKTGLGKTSNECPTKAELLALNNGKNPDVDKVIVISNAVSYGNNECVKLEDINAEQWIYTFQWDDPNGNPSFNAPATGGTYPFGSYASNRVKQVNGVNTSISQTLKDDVTKTSEGSWYTTDYDGNKGRIVPNNTSTNSKSTTVTWTQKYSGKTIQATFTQAAGSKVYSSWSYNCRVDKTSFSYSGGQSNVTAKSASRSYTWNGQGSSYTESETATVRVSSPASISGNSISIPSNSGSARSFTVTFDFPTATDQTISISQEGGQVTYVDHLSIDPTTKNVSGSGQTFDVIVDANYDKYLNGVYQENIKSEYTKAIVVEGSSSDITITKTSTGCSIKVAPNPNENSSRTYVIEFTYDSATPVRLTITQGKAVVSYPSEGCYLAQSKSQYGGFTTSDLNFTGVSNSGETIRIYYKSHRTRYVNGVSTGILEAVIPNFSSRENWASGSIDLNPIDGDIFRVSYVIISNPNPVERTTNFYARWDDDPSMNVEGNITQNRGVNYSFTFDSNDGPTEKSLSTDAAANDFPFVDIYSGDSEGRAIGFSISGVMPSWITCEIQGNGVSVPAGIRVRLDENPIHTNRSATITLVQSHSGKTLTLKVSQAGRFYNLELLGSGVVYLWDDVMKPTDAISPNTKYPNQCPTLLKHQGSLTVNNSGLGSVGSQVGNGDRINIYRYDGTWRLVTSFTLILGDQAISW